MSMDLDSKIAHLKWLKIMGVNYFCTSNPMDYSSKSFITQALHNINKNNLSSKDESCRSADIPQRPQDTMKKSSTNATSSRKLADQAKTLEELKQIIMNFNECALKKFAKNTVFSDGNPDSKIMLIGEAPGAKEDEEGIPFCGESGMLLDTMLSTIGLSREKNIYITNSVFWRPPGNRRPTQEEIDMCRPFLEKHIALIKPKLIILVGNTAATSVLGSHDGISKVRQNYYSYNNQYHHENIPTTALFHPAYLLRQPSQKKATWFDLLKMKIFLDNNIC